jgi:hypothetical protein
LLRTSLVLWLKWEHKDHKSVKKLRLYNELFVIVLNIYWNCSKIGCWKGYLGLRRTRKQGSGEGCITKSFMICTPQQILFGEQIKNNEMSRACGTYRTQKGVKDFDGEIWGTETTWKIRA